MRPLAVILIWVVILGGLAIYMQSRQYFSPPEGNIYVIQPAPGKFSLEITPTFEAAGGVDPFALEPVAKPAFVLSLRGLEIVRYAETIPAGRSVEVTWDLDSSPLEVGGNEFHVQTTTPPADPNAVHGVRLRLLRDGAEVDSRTLWSQPGKPVEGVFPIQLDRPWADDREHAHAS